MNIQDFSRMIDRYLEGKASPEEETFIRKWIDAGEEENVTLSSGERQRLAKEIMLGVSRKTGIMPRTRIMGFWLRCAAVFVAAMAGTAFYFYLVRKPDTANIVKTDEYRQIEAEPGKLKRITLKDGTIVYLFPGSALQIPPNYGENLRLVKIDGRAFFDVRQDPDKLFRVQSGQLITTVLGTAFEVKEAGTQAIVSVQSGKVRVQYGNRQLSDVGAGDRLIYDTISAGYLQEKIVGDIFNWTTGTLSFHQAPLPEVCRMIGDWYNTDITIDNKKLEKKKITANLNGQSLETTMQVLTQTAGCRYKKVGERIIIY